MKRHRGRPKGSCKPLVEVFRGIEKDLGETIDFIWRRLEPICPDIEEELYQKLKNVYQKVHYHRVKCELNGLKTGKRNERTNRYH